MTIDVWECYIASVNRIFLKTFGRTTLTTFLLAGFLMNGFLPAVVRVEATPIHRVAFRFLVADSSINLRVNTPIKGHPST
jgi:hypothetical protein